MRIPKSIFGIAIENDNENNNTEKTISKKKSILFVLNF